MLGFLIRERIFGLDVGGVGGRCRIRSRCDLGEFRGRRDGFRHSHGRLRLNDLRAGVVGFLIRERIFGLDVGGVGSRCRIRSRCDLGEFRGPRDGFRHGHGRLRLNDLRLASLPRRKSSCALATGRESLIWKATDQAANPLLGRLARVRGTPAQFVGLGTIQKLFCRDLVAKKP